MRLMAYAFTTCLSACVVLSSPASAQERSAVRQGFTLDAADKKKILIFRPSVKTGSQSIIGTFEPNAEWTERATDNIQTALNMMQKQLGYAMVIAPDCSGEDARNLAEHMALFAAVSQAVIKYQFFPGNRLPTKKAHNKAGTFDWTLGDSVASLPGARDADYGLFIYNKDAYGSPGRKILQAAAFLSVGIPVKSGVHSGYAGLVDLKTGDLIWLNADREMGGDVREHDGSKKRVRELLKGFPTSTSGKASTR